jgi:hypothetical protein
LIAERFLDKSYIGQPFFVAELAESQTNLFAVQKFIYDIIEPFKPGDFNKLVPTFKWRSIYTTYYDLIIERAYDSIGNTSVQTLSKVYRNTRVQNIFLNDQSLPYYKLHGCLDNINDGDLPLILTPDQYITHKNNRDRLFAKLYEEAHDFTFIFVGYSFADIEIRTILQKHGRLQFIASINVFA